MTKNPMGDELCKAMEAKSELLMKKLFEESIYSEPREKILPEPIIDDRKKVLNLFKQHQQAAQEYKKSGDIENFAKELFACGCVLRKFKSELAAERFFLAGRMFLKLFLAGKPFRGLKKHVKSNPSNEDRAVLSMAYRAFELAGTNFKGIDLNPKESEKQKAADIAEEALWRAERKLRERAVEEVHRQEEQKLHEEIENEIRKEEEEKLKKRKEEEEKLKKRKEEEEKLKELKAQDKTQEEEETLKELKAQDKTQKTGKCIFIIPEDEPEGTGKTGVCGELAEKNSDYCKKHAERKREAEKKEIDEAVRKRMVKEEAPRRKAKIENAKKLAGTPEAYKAAFEKKARGQHEMEVTRLKWRRDDIKKSRRTKVNRARFKKSTKCCKIMADISKLLSNYNDAGLLYYTAYIEYGDYSHPRLAALCSAKAAACFNKSGDQEHSKNNDAKAGLLYRAAEVAYKKCSNSKAEDFCSEKADACLKEVKEAEKKIKLEEEKKIKLEEEKKIKQEEERRRGSRQTQLFD